MELERLERELREARSWREEELGELKKQFIEALSKLRRENEGNETTVDFQEEEHKINRLYTRMLIPLIYAHLEGFIKKAYEELIKHINTKELEGKKLRESLSNHMLKDNFSALKGKGSFEQRTEFIKKLSLILEETNRINYKIDTKSNLNEDNLNSILKIFGIDCYLSKDKLSYMNKLVKQRNSICHGESGIISNQETIGSDIRKIIEIIDETIVCIIDYATNEKYKKN